MIPSLQGAGLRFRALSGAPQLFRRGQGGGQPGVVGDKLSEAMPLLEPILFYAYWVRAISSASTTASAMFRYEEGRGVAEKSQIRP